MPRFAASHLGLFCLPISHNKDARLIWVNDIDTILLKLHAFHVSYFSNTFVILTVKDRQFDLIKLTFCSTFISESISGLLLLPWSCMQKLLNCS